MATRLSTRNVVLTDAQAKMIEQLVGSGRYQNASEMQRDRLRLLQQREAEDAARLTALRPAAFLCDSVLLTLKILAYRACLVRRPWR